VRHLDTAIKFKLITKHGNETLTLKPSSFQNENTFRDRFVTIPMSLIENDEKFIYSFEFKKAHKGMEIMFFTKELENLKKEK
jgi:hypothetical protein